MAAAAFPGAAAAVVDALPARQQRLHAVDLRKTMRVAMKATDSKPSDNAVANRSALDRPGDARATAVDGEIEGEVVPEGVPEGVPELDGVWEGVAEGDGVRVGVAEGDGVCVGVAEGDGV